jgi:hypothetical protein
VQFLLQRARIDPGVAYSTSQLKRKSKENHGWMNRAVSKRHKDKHRYSLQEVPDIQFPDIRHLLIFKLLPGNKAVSQKLSISKLILLF